MTPEQIKKIILYEHNKEECVCHYPSVNNPDWAIVAAEKINESISYQLGMAVNNVWKAELISREVAMAIVNEFHSLSQPSKHILSEDDSLGLRREKEGGIQ